MNEGLPSLHRLLRHAGPMAPVMVIDDVCDVLEAIVRGDVDLKDHPEVPRAPEDSPRSDVYGLGRLLYRQVTGHPSVDLHLAGPESPRWDSVPPVLREPLRQAMAKDPAARWDPEGFVAVLRQVRPGLVDWPVAMPATADRSALAQTLRPSRRTRPEPPPVDRTMLLVAGALVVVLTAAGVLLGPLGGLVIAWPFAP